ncbi:hypothetical protein JCM10213_003576 [Rhodosporidiobolus nylandii]
MNSEQLKSSLDGSRSADAGANDLTFNGQGMSAADRRGEDSSYGGGERGKDFAASGGSAYGDGMTEFGGAGRLNDESYSRGEPGGSTGIEKVQDDSDRSAELAGAERNVYP